MELDQSSREKSEEVIWCSSDHDQDSGHHVKSYRCSFCQRGFSNAQALGGHMNIHRKDRAKLKEFSSDKITRSFDLTKNQSPPPLLQGEASQLQESSDERCCTTKRQSASPIEIDSDTGDAKDDFFGNELQLSLSIETSSSSNEKDENNSRVGRRQVKKSMQLNHGASRTTELDLELRLGPEPHQAASKG